MSGGTFVRGNNTGRFQNPTRRPVNIKRLPKAELDTVDRQLVSHLLSEPAAVWIRRLSKGVVAVRLDNAATII